MAVFHFLTSVVTMVLSIYLIVHNGLTCHPIGIICYVALFIIAYEQLRPVVGRFLNMCIKDYNNIVKEEQEKIERDDFEVFDDDDVI